MAPGVDGLTMRCVFRGVHATAVEITRDVEAPGVRKLVLPRELVAPAPADRDGAPPPADRDVAAGRFFGFEGL